MESLQTITMEDMHIENSVGAKVSAQEAVSQVDDDDFCFDALQLQEDCVLFESWIYEGVSGSGGIVRFQYRARGRKFNCSLTLPECFPQPLVSDTPRAFPGATAFHVGLVVLTYVILNGVASFF